MKPKTLGTSVRVVLFGLAAFSMSTFPLRSQVVATTLCEIHRNPMKYNGQMVRVEAPYYGGLHGQELLDESCPELKTDNETIPPGIDVTLPSVEEAGERPVRFSLDRQSWEAFVAFHGTIKRFEPIRVTLVGQIRAKRRFHLKEFGGGLAGNGYGTRGLYRLQIVVRSVERFAKMNESTP